MKYFISIRQSQAEAGYLILFFLICFTSISKSHSQQIPFKAEVVFSYPLLDKNKIEGFLDSVFNPFDKKTNPGVAVIILKGDEIIAQKNYGLASIEHGVPFTANHIARLPYSEGREFISIAAVLMEADGFLELDDKVRKYFPKLPDWSDPVSIWDLLNHKSGFVDEWSTLLLMHGSMSNRLDESQFLRLLYNQPYPEVTPGEGYMYSNSDFGLLRLILEKASGENLNSYLTRRVFEPLGMYSTRFNNNSNDVIPHFAQTYAPLGDGNYERYTGYKSSPGGNYDVLTSANDLIIWAKIHADNSSEIARAVQKLITKGSYMIGKENHYAFGHSTVSVNGEKVIRHEGVLDCNYITRIPSLDLTVITFGNRFYEEDNKAIINFLLGVSQINPHAPFLKEPFFLTVPQLEKYAGTYLMKNKISWESISEVRALIDAAVANNNLILTMGWGKMEFVPVAEDKFYWHDNYAIQMEFTSTKEEEIQVVMKYDDGFPDDSLVKVSTFWQPDLDLLQSLTGSYYSQHLDYYWNFYLNDAGKLVLKRPTLGDVPIEPDRMGEFLLPIEKFPGVSSNSWIRFHNDVEGKVTHLTVWNPRLMNHRFDRRN